MIYKIGIIYKRYLIMFPQIQLCKGGANQAVAVIRYSWCRAVGFIRAAVGCVCAVEMSCAVCVLAMWLLVWLQDDK